VAETLDLSLVGVLASLVKPLADPQRTALVLGVIPEPLANVVDVGAFLGGQVVELAQEQWVRVTANMSLGAYDVFVATGQHPDPTWPEQSFAELLRLGFKGHYIDSPDHPVLKKLRGEV
jgi:hypothetical protein